MKRYAVSWTATARDDLEEIAAFILVDGPVNALAVVERIEARARTLAVMPLRGRVVPELRWNGVATYLEVIERPWRLIYRVDGRLVLVQAVIDGRRQVEDLLLERFLRH